jgi:hypothetical protein
LDRRQEDDDAVVALTSQWRSATVLSSVKTEGSIINILIYTIDEKGPYAYIEK